MDVLDELGNGLELLLGSRTACPGCQPQMATGVFVRECGSDSFAWVLDASPTWALFVLSFLSMKALSEYTPRHQISHVGARKVSKAWQSRAQSGLVGLLCCLG